MPAPEVSAVVGYHPSVTVAMHEFRICGARIENERDANRLIRAI
jgi:hypothetical protein